MIPRNYRRMQSETIQLNGLKAPSPYIILLKLRQSIGKLLNRTFSERNNSCLLSNRSVRPCSRKSVTSDPSFFRVRLTLVIFKCEMTSTEMGVIWSQILQKLSCCPYQRCFIFRISDSWIDVSSCNREEIRHSGDRIRTWIPDFLTIQL